jgi:serine O-acetyltransferase
MPRLPNLSRVLCEVRDDVVAARERDPAAAGVRAWVILATWPGVHALLVHRIAHALHTARVPLVPRLLALVTRAITGIEIHPAADIGQRLFIDHGSGVVIGETAEIGDDVTIYQGVTLGGTSLTRGAKRHPTLERGVIVGAGAKVLGGFTIGAEAKIGSNAVVTKPVPARGTAVGNPARIIVPAAAAAASGSATTQTDANGAPRDAKRATERSAFCAYGITPNADDPVSLAIHGLIDHAATQSKRIDEIVDALERLGTSLEGLQGADAALLDLRRLSAAIAGKVEGATAER